MPAKTKAAAPNPDETRLYPNLERFLETNGPEATGTLFEQTKGQLGEIAKGAKAPAVKKALAGIGRAEQLLASLQEVRARLEVDARAAKKTRR